MCLGRGMLSTFPSQGYMLNPKALEAMNMLECGAARQDEDSTQSGWSLSFAD